MIKRIAQTAGFTGLLAALLLTLLQSFWVAPLILQAETYENAPAATEVAHQHAEGAAAHTHDAEAWSRKMAGSASCPPQVATWWSPSVLR